MAWGLLTTSITAGFMSGAILVAVMLLTPALGILFAAYFTPMYRRLEGRSVAVMGLVVSTVLLLLMAIVQSFFLFSARPNPDSRLFVLDLVSVVSAVGYIILIGWTVVEMLRMGMAPR